MGADERVRGYRPRLEDADQDVPTSGDYDDEDVGYEQWEEAYLEGDDGSIQEAYLLDPDEGFTEEDLLFAENAFSPSMMGSPVPKDGLQKPDVPGWELDSDEATTDVYEAIDDGQVFYPAEDPPIRRADGPQDAEINAGFATSADDIPPDVYDEPDQLEYSDAEIADHIRQALRLHAETADLEVKVQVVDGVATLRGRVPTLQDVALVEDIVSEVDGVEEVREQLTIG